MIFKVYLDTFDDTPPMRIQATSYMLDKDSGALLFYNEDSAPNSIERIALFAKGSWAYFFMEKEPSQAVIDVSVPPQPIINAPE